MKSLFVGEHIREIFAINCKFGKSALYLSNLGIMIENSKGMFLELEHIDVLSLQPIDKKSVKIVWKENDSVYDFIFSNEKPSELTSKYKAIQEDCLNSLKAVGVKVEQLAQERINIQNPVIELRPASRFEKIPPYVPEDQIWNDCWRDPKFNLYVTHNKYLAKMSELLNRPHQIKYRIESKDEGIVAKPDKVVLKFGIPAVNLEIEGKKAWFLLPTMNKTLLSQEIKAARFSQEPTTRIEFVSE